MTSTLWKLDENTHEFKQDILREIKDLENQLTDGSLLQQQNDHLFVREYTLIQGELDSLRKVLEKLRPEERPDEST